MIVWSIEAAKNSGCFDRIIVSTDDDEIANVAKTHGAEVPFMRPAELSDDYTGTTAVVAHAIKWQKDNDKTPENVCCIYATAPFVQIKDINRGLALLTSRRADFAFSVTSYAFPIQRAIRITCDQRIEMFQPEHCNTRSQDLEEAWHDAGQFYWGTLAAWMSGKSSFNAKTVPVILPRYRVQDIDTFEDWTRAEIMFSALERGLRP